MSSTSTPTASLIRAPVAYSSSSSARFRRPRGIVRARRLQHCRSRSTRAAPWAAGAPARAAAPSWTDRRATVPSASRNRCQPRTATTVRAADDAASGGCPSSPVRRVARKSVTSAAVDLGRDRAAPRDGQESQVAVQVTAVGQQRVAGDAALHGQVVEVAAQLGGERCAGTAIRSRIRPGARPQHRAAGSDPTASRAPHPAESGRVAAFSVVTPRPGRAGPGRGLSPPGAGPPTGRAAAESAPRERARRPVHGRPAPPDRPRGCPPPPSRSRCRPRNTASTASASGTRTTRRSASSCSASAGRPTGASGPRARKIRTVSSVKPGEVATSSSTDHVAAAKPVSSSSSRAAVRLRRLAVDVHQTGRQLPQPAAAAGAGTARSARTRARRRAAPRSRPPRRARRPRASRSTRPASPRRRSRTAHDDPAVRHAGLDDTENVGGGASIRRRGRRHRAPTGVRHPVRIARRAPRRASAGPSGSARRRRSAAARTPGSPARPGRTRRTAGAAGSAGT